MIKEILNPAVQKFIKDHQLDDPFQLALEAKKYPGIPVDLAVGQIRSRQKAEKKVPSWTAVENIAWPPALSLEQSSSEQTAHFKSELLRGDMLADLTGGTGVDTYFLSKNFRKTIYVETDPWLCDLAKHNFPLLEQPDIEVRNETAEEFIKGLDGKVSAIYIDPSRRKARQKRAFLLEDLQPNVLLLLPKLLEKSETILIKLSPLIDIGYLFKNIPNIQKVLVLAVDNECREVLCLINGKGSPKQQVEAVNLQSSGQRDTFRFDLDKEKALNIQAGLPGKYIYQPNAAIMKAGAFKSIAAAFQLQKLHINTHLYTSSEKMPNFPGAVFLLKNIIKPQRKALREFLPSGRANLTVRNFPATVAELKKRLQISDGGNDHLFATTLMDGRKVLLHTERSIQ